MSGTVSRRSLEHRRLESSVAMAHGYLRASRGARRLHLDAAEVTDRRAQALDYAMGAFWQAMHWSDDAVANQAIRIAIEVQLDFGHDVAIREIFTELLAIWGLEEFRKSVDRPFTTKQLEDLGYAMEAFMAPVKEAGDAGIVELRALARLHQGS